MVSCHPGTVGSVLQVRCPVSCWSIAVSLRKQSALIEGPLHVSRTPGRRGTHGPHSWQKRAPMAWKHGPYTQGACSERGAPSGVHAPAVPRPAPACHPLRCLHRSHWHAWRPSWPRRGASASLQTRHACVMEPGSTAGPRSSLILRGGECQRRHTPSTALHAPRGHIAATAPRLSHPRRLVPAPSAVDTSSPQW